MTAIPEKVPGLMGLAPELREKIWKEALELEAENRVVFYDHTFDSHGPRIIPRKQLVSPMMGICRETRRFARLFYPVQLKVYRMRPITVEVSDVFPIPDEAGAVYLRPESDHFVTIQKGFAASFLRVRDETEPFAQYISSRLDGDMLAMVRNLVFAQVYEPLLRPDGLSDGCGDNETTSYQRRHWNNTLSPLSKEKEGWGNDQRGSYRVAGVGGVLAGDEGDADQRLAEPHPVGQDAASRV
ncbi:hypothetical protein PG997_001680 [Apiospora hydei]|uniref:2EXR domain-containing protein n=1 Tax=Apiospora hydei TaxID=1337664 RepID=A0ABR1XE92_9PEZI